MRDKLFTLRDQFSEVSPALFTQAITSTCNFVQCLSPIGIVLAGMCFVASQSLAQTSDLQNENPDVSIIVIPTSRNSARVSIAYQKHVSIEKVKQDISRLASKGWNVDPKVSLQNRSLRPGDEAHYPVTTSAAFVVRDAPQLIAGKPDILTYARAFQQWDHIAILFSIQDNSSNGEIEKFDSPEFMVEKIPERGSYHYEILIKNHTEQLPTPTMSGTIAKNSEIPKNSTQLGYQKPAPLPLVPLALLVVGSGIIIGAGVYFFLSNREKTKMSA